MARSLDWLHEGYLDGLKGNDPDPKLSECPGSEYNEGWIIGAEDRKNGVLVPKFVGYHKDEELPVQRGMTVTIPKDTIVKTIGQDPKPAGKTYKVRVDHILGGTIAYWDNNGQSPRLIRPTAPSIRWAGSGGYWSEVDINEIPEAQK